MRIGYVTETYPPELNGVAHTVARAVDHLRARGHDVDLVRPRQPHEAALDADDELRTAGMALPMYKALRLGLVAPGALVARWQARRPALVHVATEGPLGAAAVSAAHRLGLPVTSDFRTNFHAYSHHYGLGFAAGLVFAWLRRFHNRTDRTLVPTPQLRELLAGQGFERLEVVGRGVDTELFSPARRSALRRAAWGVREDQPVVLYVGRLAREKNVGLVFDAYRTLANRARGAKLVLVGDGPLKEQLARAHPDALFTGPRRGLELAECYASADVFLFPSLTDTFGNVVLEALASGLLVVAFDHGAANAHMTDLGNGLLARPGDVHGFIAAASAAAAQMRVLERLRGAARASAETLGWDAALRRLETTLLQVAAEHHALAAQPAAA